MHGEVIKWKRQAKDAGHEWLIAMDEIGMWHTGALPDELDPDHDSLRRHALWGSLLAGAAGVEWYFGARYPHNDLTLEDWRTRANLWKQTRHAMDFFDSHLPYWEMEPLENLTTDKSARCFGKPEHVYAIYITSPGNGEIGLSLPTGQYTLQWFDPKNGGQLQEGSITKFDGGASQALGNPPIVDNRDWVVLVEKRK